MGADAERIKATEVMKQFPVRQPLFEAIKLFIYIVICIVAYLL